MRRLTPTSVRLYFFHTPWRAVPIRHRWMGPTIELLTRSRVNHVAIGALGVVINPVPSGDTVWAQSVFEARYPGELVWAVDVYTCLHSDTLVRYVRFWRDPIPSLLKYLTLGVVESQDCVSEATLLLGAPSDIISPAGLARWLMDNGGEDVTDAVRAAKGRK